MPSSPNTEASRGSHAPAVRLSGLRKEFSGRPPVIAVDDVDLSIGSGEFFAFFTLAGALLGVWLFALVKPRLPE